MSAWLIWRDREGYRNFKLADDSVKRQKYFRQWVFESLIFWGMIPLVLLLAAGHESALRVMPEFLQNLSSSMKEAVDADADSLVGSIVSGISYAIVPFLLIGPTVLTLLRVYSEHQKRRGGSAENQTSDLPGDIGHLFPRNKDERFWTTALSVCAGVNEELCFRLLIPILVFSVSGSAVLAIAVSVMWFGLVHAYQGWVGVLATAYLGAIFTLVYLITWQLWLVMLIHAVLDLNSLSLGPWFAEWLKVRDANKRA